MKIIKIERLDHLGLISGVIKDLRIVEMIDSRITTDDQEEITTGEAIAGMIINGLGFSNRPLSLTPQFFENKPLDLFFREGVEASMFNRFKLGRSLDKVYTYGCNPLFSEIASSVCQRERVDLRFNSLDTTSFSLNGEYLPDSDEQAVSITHGYSKDHRPDLKQIVLELMVSQDGGIPFISKSWDGNTSDNQIFRERSAMLLKEFKRSESPRYIIADSKLYAEDNAENLAVLEFITRIPQSIKQCQELIIEALITNHWSGFDDARRYQCFELQHNGISQRWIVVFSQAAYYRAETTLKKACKKEKEAIDKQLFHLQAKRFQTPKEACDALDELAKGWKYHKQKRIALTKHQHYATKGRPGPNTPVKSVDWQINCTFVADKEVLRHLQNYKACFVLGTNIKKESLSNEEIIAGYTGQSSVERGFRFLKDPLFFVSSLFVTKPSRIQGLLMVMTLALLVYSVAQRRLRQKLKEQNEIIPNQIQQPTKKPTMRWVFQLMEGIHRVIYLQNGEQQTLIEGLKDIHINILKLLGIHVCQMYQIPSG
jgi:transposase